MPSAVVGNGRPAFGTGVHQAPRQGEVAAGHYQQGAEGVGRRGREQRAYVGRKAEAEREEERAKDRRGETGPRPETVLRNEAARAVAHRHRTQRGESGEERDGHGRDPRREPRQASTRASATPAASGPDQASPIPR